MKDGQGRQIDYLRISLTDRCNLRCIYCMPEHGVKSIPHESVLTLEEVHKAIECASQLGIKHIRFTGGEPTVRKGLLSLIERTAQTPGIESVALTTNAILLPGMAADLKAAGLSRVNISLDTLDTEQYRFITRLGNLDDALKGIEAALSAGLFPVKLNTVVVRSLNQDLLSFARLTVDAPLHVRFIEYMPIGNSDDCGGCGWGCSRKGDYRNHQCPSTIHRIGKPATRHCHARWMGSGAILSPSRRSRNRRRDIGNLKPLLRKLQPLAPYRRWQDKTLPIQRHRVRYSQCTSERQRRRGAFGIQGSAVP